MPIGPVLPNLGIWPLAAVPIVVVAGSWLERRFAFRSRQKSILTGKNATTAWGIAAVVLALLASVFAAGLFLAHRSVTTTSTVRVVASTLASASTQTTIPVTVYETVAPYPAIPATVYQTAPPAPMGPRLRPAPQPLLPVTSEGTGWAALLLFAGVILVVSVPLLARKTASAQKVRVWTAALVGLGALVTIQSVGLLFVPAFIALGRAARAGRNPRSKRSDE